MTNINFPDSPSDGDVFGERRYNATKGVWEDYVLPGNTTAEDLLEVGQDVAYVIQYLAVAGGGGGGAGSGGGGGAGGVISNFGLFNKVASTQVSSVYEIEIGAGGNGAVSRSTLPTSGNNTVAFGTTSFGGGHGGADNGTGQQPASGGSGGGGAYWGLAGNNRNGASGTNGQGNSGGDALTVNGNGAGGGGAGGQGSNNPNGNGGIGLNFSSQLSSLYGDSGYFASGGGGANSGTASLGGGGDASGSTAQSGQDNTGGGGGGGGLHAGSVSGAGGSGVVIFKVSPLANVSFSVGLTEANGGSGQTIGGYKVYSVTAGTGTVTIS